MQLPRVPVDLVGDFDASVAEPAGDLGDGDVLGEGGGCVAVAQRVRGEFRGQPGSDGGPVEILLVGAAGDELVPAALEQVPVWGGAMVGDVLVDRLGDVARGAGCRGIPPRAGISAA